MIALEDFSAIIGDKSSKYMLNDCCEDQVPIWFSQQIHKQDCKSEVNSVEGIIKK
jgi:hypothetical protein